MVRQARFAVATLILIAISGCQTVSTQKSSADLRADDLPVRYVKRQSSDSSLSKSDSVLLELEKQDQPKDLWQLTREHMSLPELTGKREVQSRIEWYAKHDRYLNKVAARASRYYHYILHQVIERKMPAELALLPVIESSYDPFVKSPARAAGPWQFIPSTGDHFGLKRNWWYDGRRDIIESTDAALTYLTYLHDFFDGDWLLALAAYNAGEGTVRRAVRKNEKRGKPTDFWSLDLPKESKAYVPKLLAVAEIFRNPQKYQLSLTPLPDQPYFEIVETGGQIDLARAAELAQVDLDEIYQLNPGFNRWATDPEGPHRLLVPVATASTLSTKLALLDSSERMSWARYEVRPGDTLGLIAQRFNTSISSIQSTNSINGSLIRVGQSLLIPAALMDATQYALSSDQRTERRLNRAAPNGKLKSIYKVVPGDTLWGIAQRHGLSARQIARWNEMGVGETLRTEQQLVLFVDQPASGEASGGPAYTVRQGDSLSRIAELHSVSLNDLLQWNNLEVDSPIQPGQQLQIAASPESS